MLLTLESLDLTPEERLRAEEAIRRLACDKWRQAGHPSGEDLHFWSKAEQEWILFQYVPHRLPPQAVGDDADEVVSADSSPHLAGSIP